MTLQVMGTLAMTLLWLSMAWTWRPFRHLSPLPVRAIVETLLTLLSVIIVLRYLRVPFLDSFVATLASKLPDKFKWRNGATKYILREAFKNILPESTRRRKKLGFPVPVAEWLGVEQLKEILSCRYIQTHFDQSEIEKLFENTRKNARKIYLLLMLALWYNVYIK